MSGHSKWKKIKRQKQAEDQKRGNLFTKLGQAITLAVREKGGGDPDMNFVLRMAIDNAKEANMPKDTIQRAIDKGLGKGGGDILEDISYDLVGPNGIAMIVDCLTDNKNRTINEIRQLAGDHGFSMGNDSLGWQFKQKGRIVLLPKELERKQVKGKEELIEKEIDSEELMLDIMELNGVEDVTSESEEITIITSKNNFSEILEQIEEKKLKVRSAKIAKIAINKVESDQGVRKKVEDLIDGLDDIDDVIEVWTNINNI